MAANTDCLLSILSDFFLHKPNEENEITDDHSYIVYNNLRQVNSTHAHSCSNNIV